MGRECAWCETTTYCMTEMPPRVSHVLCPTCLQELRAALATSGITLSGEGHAAH